MMLKKYVQPDTMACSSFLPLDNVTSSDSEQVITASATVNDVTKNPIAVTQEVLVTKRNPECSAIDQFLTENNISILEKHYPEDESELSEISYLLNGIADHICEADDLFHTLRKAIAESNGKFTYNTKNLSIAQIESVKAIMKLLKLCGVFSELRAAGSYSGTVSSATRVRNFISGTWLELFGQQHCLEVISKKANEMNLSYEILCNVKVEDSSKTQHEIDLIFSVGDCVFAAEMKSGLNFMDYDRYRLLAEYLHLIPDRFILVNSTLLDKDATKCISYFYRYYICNSADYIDTLSVMIDKAFNE